MSIFEPHDIREIRQTLGRRKLRDETGEVMFDNDALDGSNPAASS